MCYQRQLKPSTPAYILLPMLLVQICPEQCSLFDPLWLDIDVEGCDVDVVEGVRKVQHQ
jgi:hypothetical protein